MLPRFVTLLSQREITSPSVFIICYADLLKKKKNLHSKSSSPFHSDVIYGGLLFHSDIITVCCYCFIFER